MVTSSISREPGAEPRSERAQKPSPQCVDVSVVPSSSNLTRPRQTDPLYLQRTIGNRAFLLYGPGRQPTVQRQVEWDMGDDELTKVGRFDFDNRIQTAMDLAPQQARCHTVSYEEIERTVRLSINECVKDGWKDTTLGSLEGLIEAVFSPWESVQTTSATSKHRRSPELGGRVPSEGTERV
jgi:hypothetical protein